MVASEIQPSLEGMDGLERQAQPPSISPGVAAQDGDEVDLATLINQPHVTPSRDVPIRH